MKTRKHKIIKGSIHCSLLATHTMKQIHRPAFTVPHKSPLHTTTTFPAGQQVLIMAEGFFELLDSDLRLLSAEARKLESFAHQITGLFTHSDTPNIKESCERALQKLRQLSAPGSRKTMDAIRQSPVRCVLSDSCICTFTLVYTVFVYSGRGCAGRRMLA